MNSIFDFIRNTGIRRGPSRVLGGIGGAISEATGADVVLVRLLMVVACLLPVIGPTLYVVLWILLPWQDGTIPLAKLVNRFRNGNAGETGNGPTIVHD